MSSPFFVAGVRHHPHKIAREGAFSDGLSDHSTPEVVKKIRCTNKINYRETSRETLYHAENQGVSLSISALLNNAVQHDKLVINSRYISDDVKKALLESSYWFIKSDMGTGKTHMLIDLVAEQSAKALTVYVANLRSIVRGTVNRLNDGLAARGHAGGVVHYQDANAINMLDASAVVTTFNTLPKIVELARQLGRVINLVVIDESESGAQFLVSDSINNGSDVSQALEWLSQQAKQVLLMDAHLSTNTLAFARSYMPDLEFRLLENIHTPWQDYTCSWVEGGESGALAKAEALLKDGKRVFLVATSKARAASMQAKLQARGALAGLKVLNAFETADTEDNEHAELIAAKADYSLFNQYDLVIASPTVGTGVSIENKPDGTPHFDCVVALFVRHKDAPDSLGALQMPFRVRNTKDKHLYLVPLDYGSQGAPRVDWQVRKDLKNSQRQYKLLLDAHVSDETARAFLLAEASRFSTFRAALDIEKERAFNCYYDDIKAAFSAKGIQEIADESADELPDLKALNKELNAAKKVKRIKELASALALDEKQIAALELKQRAQERLAKKERQALEKHYLVKAYHPADSTSEPSADEIALYINQQDKGIAAARNTIGNALLTLADIRQVEKAFLLDAAFKKDITDQQHIKTRATWELDRVLCHAVGLRYDPDQERYFIEDASLVINQDYLTDRTLGRSIVQRLGVAIPNYNAANPDRRINPKELADTPVKAVAKLIKARLKVKIAKVSGSDAYTLQTEQPVIDNLNNAAKRGAFGLARVANAMTVKGLLDADGDLSADVCKRLGIDHDIKRFVLDVLERIPPRQHKQVLAKYMTIAERPRAAGDNFAPVARANHYLHDVLAKHAA